MNLSTEQKRTHGHGEQTCGCQGSGGGDGQEFGVGRCKLLRLEWIGNEVLLHSTGNAIHSPVTEQDGRLRKRMYTYVQLGHFAV